MIFFLTWILLVVVVAFVADSMNRKFWNYFWLSFFLSPVVGFLILLFKGNAGKKCPKCAEIVKPEAKICKHCKHEFAEVTKENNDFYKNKITFEEFIKLDDQFKAGLITNEEYNSKRNSYLKE